MPKRFGALTLLFMAWAATVPADAAVVASIDRFLVTKNGSAFFDDTFADGFSPPSAPNFPNGVPASYFVQGNFVPNSESGGRLAFDSVGFIPTANVLGVPATFATATLLTNIDPANLVNGLKSNSTFSVRGVFDYVVPSGQHLQSTSYGVRLTDGGGDDVLDLRVLLGPGNTPEVFFRRQDFISETLTILGEVPLPVSGFDQIALILTRGSLLNNSISASFELLSGGIPIGPSTVLAMTADIFNGENFTRADFRATAPVPEPSTYALMLAGLIALGGLSRSRRNRS